MVIFVKYYILYHIKVSGVKQVLSVNWFFYPSPPHPRALKTLLQLGAVQKFQR